MKGVVRGITTARGTAGVGDTGRLFDGAGDVEQYSIANGGCYRCAGILYSIGGRGRDPRTNGGSGMYGDGLYVCCGVGNSGSCSMR